MLPEEIKALLRSRLSESDKPKSDSNSLVKYSFDLTYGYSDEKVNELCKLGKTKLEETIATRIIENHKNDVLNYCSECGKLARTPKARQCRHCGNKWFKS
jgi:hypothetical protein